MMGMMSWRMQEQEWRKGPWTPAEDNLLIEYVRMHGEGRWSSVASCTELKRSGKSCRLRWVNYLRPGLKKGHITPQEEGIIIELHALWGNKWSTIARYLPGRTDNEIKNYWRTNFKKKDTASQNVEKRKQKAAFRRIRHQQQVNQAMNNFMLPYPEENQSGTMCGSQQANMEESTTAFAGPVTNSDQQHHNEPAMAQDAAPWWDTVSEDGLWSGFLWNLDDGNPSQPVAEPSFSSYF